MIYQSDHLTLRTVMDVFRGEVNDVMICEEVSAEKGSYYTLIAVKDHETAKKALHVMEHSEKEVECCVDMFSSHQCFCLVFPYVKTRPLSEFYMGNMIPLAACEEICLNLLLQCMSSSLPYPFLELVLKQQQIHLLKDNSIALGYCMDLKELKADSGQKQCAMECAIIIRQLLSEKAAKKNVAYQILLKKVPKQNYHDFRELYKDIRLSRASIEKKSFKKTVQELLWRNQAKILHALLYASVLLLVVVIIMFLTNTIWGDIPFLRIFHNSFKQIGTESLVR